MINFVFSASLSTPTGDAAVWNLKETLVSGGFTVVSSSNGSTFSAGDNLTTVSDLANSNAWFIVRQPQSATSSHGGVQREYAFQRSTTSRTWRAKYSYSASFTGSANATTLPDADDQVRILGAEIPSFGFDSNTFQTDGTYTTHIAVDMDPPHSWFLVNIPNGGGDPYNAWMVDGMLSGTFPPEDVDPYVQYFADNTVLAGAVGFSGPSLMVTASTIVSPAAWFAKNTGNEVYGGCGVLQYSAQDTSQKEFVDGLGTTNHVNGNDDLLPLFWFRGANANPNGPGGFKGASMLMKIPSGPARTTGDTFSTSASGSKDYILFHDIAVVWDGSDPVV